MKKLNTIFFITFSLFALVYSQQAVCDICQYGQDCLNKTECTLEGYCSGAKLSRVDEDDIQQILSIHNDYRSHVASGEQENQEGASNMHELLWSDELSNIAQCYTNQCEFNHKRCQLSDDRGTFGQNIFSKWQSNKPDDLDYKTAIGSWFNEVEKFHTDHYDNNFESNYETGHYTQLVWAATTHVGCSKLVYLNNSDTYWYSVTYCNYYPPGNVQGGSMYETGAAASKCDYEKSSNYPKLCAS